MSCAPLCPPQGSSFGLGMLQQAHVALSRRVSVIEQYLGNPGASPVSVCTPVYEYGTNKFLGNLSVPKNLP